ncbi:MAG: AMP-binding protein [Gammaproteobacteria bacterium]|uniref:AMP-binding protein n=1 Tax=Candidatus Thiopontia autotrophica TaxID=2841688 RepID=A0A8J6PAP5_9GAMM|nr:AMP-binding protein [Candidatus Thiopontia autotrophica]MBL6969015.1 AMP-binding protein [Gammaproteobacteria bacterium]
MSVDEVDITLETSGTEGVAKQVSFSVERLRASARMGRALEDLQSGDCWLNCLPLNHVGGLSIKYRCEEAGAAMLLHEGFDPEKIYGDLKRHFVTHISLVPVMLSKLLDYFGDKPAPTYLKTVLIGGDHLPKSLAQRAVERGWPIVVSYGLTETASRITMLRLSGENIAAWDDSDVGPPLPGVSVTIGGQGEIRIRSDQLLGDHEVVTADHGAVDDSGHLHVYGRLDCRIISGGVTIDPVTIEQLMISAPGVKDVGVGSVPDKEWGERIVAVIAGDMNQDIVAGWMRENIPSGLRPRELLLVSELRRNRLGKLDREWLKNQAESAFSIP